MYTPYPSHPMLDWAIPAKNLAYVQPITISSLTVTPYHPPPPPPPPPPPFPPPPPPGHLPLCAGG